MDVSRQKKTKTLFDLFSDLIHFLKMPQILYNEFKKLWTKKKCCRSEFKNGKCALENVGRVLDLNSQLNFDIWKQLKLTSIMADMVWASQILSCAHHQFWWKCKQKNGKTKVNLRPF